MNGTIKICQLWPTKLLKRQSILSTISKPNGDGSFFCTCKNFGITFNHAFPTCTNKILKSLSTISAIENKILKCFPTMPILTYQNTDEFTYNIICNLSNYRQIYQKMSAATYQNTDEFLDSVSCDLPKHWWVSWQCQLQPTWLNWQCQLRCGTDGWCSFRMCFLSCLPRTVCLFSEVKLVTDQGDCKMISEFWFWPFTRTVWSLLKTHHQKPMTKVNRLGGGEKAH